MIPHGKYSSAAQTRRQLLPWALGATGTITEQTLTAENFCFGEGDDGQGSNQFSR